MAKRCEDCRYSIVNGNGNGGAQRECRRNPPHSFSRRMPQLAAGEPMFMRFYPFTKADDWCGEWKAVEENGE